MNDSDTPEPTIALPAGSRFGAYEVVRVLGTGAFGAVYEALRHPLRKRVALKVLHADMARNPEAVARFLREAEAAAKLDHPHIVDVQDLGTIDGSSFIAMEFLEGETLDARIDRVGRLSVVATLDVMFPILSAVAAVHARGIIHRDLKPANVFLTPGPQGDFPRLLDFGIAKDTTTKSSLTRTTAVLGTPSYMSPEQVRESRLIDARTDVWALGVVLHECVTGRRPFDGASLFETFEQIMRAPIVAPGDTVPGVDPGFDVVVLQALQREPDQRIATVRALGAALLPFASLATKAAWSRDFTRSDPPLPAAPLPSGESRAAPRAPPITLAAQSLPVAPVVPMRSSRPVVLFVGALTTVLILIAVVVSLRGRTPAAAIVRPPLVVRSNPEPAPVAPTPVVAPVAATPVVAPVVAPPEPPAPAPAVVAPAPRPTGRTPGGRRPPPTRPTPTDPTPTPTAPTGIGNY
jgi:serine/threonine protein kinase